MDWRYNTLWFDQVEKGKIYVQDFKEKTSFGNQNNIDKAQYVFLNHLNREKNQFLSLLPSDNILYLALTWANIKDFQCIQNFKALKRLETHYCVKLETDKGLGVLNDSLEFLHINQSKKFVFSDELLQLKKLKVLCLNACAPVENLNFLKHFPQLIDFRFVDTNILDGNLKPIIEHPTIRTVGFLNKKHYNMTDNQVKFELENKSDVEYIKVAYKGEFKTFRYNYDWEELQ